MANQSLSKDARIQYAIYGAIFGCLFPVVATLFDAYLRGLGFGLNGLIEAQRTQPLHWIIDTAPVFLGLFAMMAGVKQQEVLDINEGLENTVQQRTQMLSEQNEELTAMQSELELTLDRISQSINYAQRIQEAIIAGTEELKLDFPGSFVMFRPRDVVSGDFPWYLKKDNYIYVAAVDCTGHGVPGAFMSLIGYFLLNKIVKETGVSDTGQILNELHNEVVRVLRQESDLEVHDGMDMAICRIDTENREIMYSGAGNPVYHVSGKELTEYKADYFSVGGVQYKRGKRKPYGSQTFTYQDGDLVSMFSDGITDQYSNNGEKKFGFKKIKEHLITDGELPAEKLQERIETKMNDWMGNHRQMDDMLLMGVRL